MTNHLNITHWNVSVWMCLPASLQRCTLSGCLNSLPVPASPHSSRSNAALSEYDTLFRQFLTLSGKRMKRCGKYNPQPSTLFPLLEITWNRNWLMIQIGCRGGTAFKMDLEACQEQRVSKLQLDNGSTQGIVSHLYCIYMNVVKIKISKEPNPLKFCWIWRAWVDKDIHMHKHTYYTWHAYYI